MATGFFMHSVLSLFHQLYAAIYWRNCGRAVAFTILL